jgi:hypothetical protein
MKLSHRFGVFSLVMLPTIALAVKPDKTDSDLGRWFESLRRPSNPQVPCCSISDCKFAESRIVDGHYEVIIEGRTYAVPEDSIIRDTYNPNMKAVVCINSIDPRFASNPRDAPPDKRPFRIQCFVPQDSTV